jgi:VWFA-related protein
MGSKDRIGPPGRVDERTGPDKEISHMAKVQTTGSTTVEAHNPHPCEPHVSGAASTTPGARTTRLLGLLALLLLTAPTTRAQDEASRHGIFLDTIDVNLVNIEVRAVDQDGNPVQGLTKEDFLLRVDGEPVEITNFFAVADHRRVLPEEAGATDSDLAETAPPAAATPLRTAQEQAYIVVFIDNGNIAPNHRKRVFDDLRDHLDELMEPADRVMVVSQDGEITIEQPFTSDEELILAALERQEKISTRGNMLSLEPRLVQRQIVQGQAPPGADSLATGTSPDIGAGGPLPRPTFDVDARRTYSAVSGYAQAAQTAGKRTLAVLSRFVGSLAGLPGRKAIVYVSDGLELAPGEYLFRFWDYKYSTIANREVGISNVDSEIDRYRLREPFEDLIAKANANRVAFYTIEGGSDHGMGDAVSAETPVAVVDSLARTADGEREESLRALAYETGGVPLLNSAGVESLLTQLDRDFSNYYSLGYPSPHEGDGKYHRVEVIVRRLGVKARVLDGYRDKTADERLADQTLATLLHDVGANPLEVQVEIGKESPVKGKKTFVVPVLVKVPMSRLVFLPQDKEHMGRLSIFIAVADRRGRVSEPQKIEVPVRIPNEELLTAMNQTAAYAAKIEMRPGEQKLAIGVRDEVAAVDSTLNLNLQVGG